MPELPEVETTKRGIRPHLTGQVVRSVVVRQPRLRWPIPQDLNQQLIGQQVISIARRAKYLLIELPHGTLIIHLGMSGSLRLVDPSTPVGKHDHLDIGFDHIALRLNDPRRFGAVLWTQEPIGQHPLLVKLGPEPLSSAFTANAIFARAKGKKVAIKSFIMDNHTVVGVGNIYAQEALFMAGIHPTRPAGKVSLERYELLVSAIKQVLKKAIKAGGTTLKDFLDPNGKPGYFRFDLNVYGRAGEACVACGTTLKHRVIGQRATVYCSRCQR